MADKTGSIDVTTNVLSQSEVSPFAIFDSLRDDNRLPLKLLPLFLHEFTHHWCFDSQVGFSFFLLREHARGILGTEQEPASIAKELARPVLKYNLAMRILMPLIEGIALFAEFDADLGETGSISVPLDYCTGLFQTQSSQTDLSPRKWSNLIRSARFSPTGRGRKKIVLSAPLGLTRRSDYLRGYLSFRAIHRRAASRNHTFENDTDFFLTYARHVFFNDAVLANLLLDQTMRLETWIDAFLSRLTERISWLSSGQDREITSQFDQLLSSKRYDAFKDFHLLNLQSTDITRWNNEIDMRKNDPTNGFASQSGTRDWRRNFLVLREIRSVIRLAQTSATIQITVDNEVLADGRRLGPHNTEKNFGNDQHSGRVTLYFVPEIKTLAFIADVKGWPVRIGLPKAFLDHPSGRMISAAITLFHAMEASGIYGKSDIVDMQEMASWFIGHLELEASTNRRASTFWNEVAFWDVDAAQKEPLQGKMEFAGIGQLLDCDDLLLDALCAMSVCSATNRPLSDIDAHFRSLGLEKRSIIESLRRNQDQNGFQFIDNAVTADTHPEMRLKCFV